jgi:hypothetical protein
MRLSIAALAVLAIGTNAFKDTSPFILFSSSPYVQASTEAKTPTNDDCRLPYGPETNLRPLRASHEIINSATEILEQCTSDIYFFITAPGVTSSELSSNAPHLRKAINDGSVKGRYTVNEVVGLSSSTTKDLAALVEKECHAARAKALSTTAEALTQKQEGTPMVVSWDYESLDGAMEGRVGDIANTGMLSKILILDLNKRSRLVACANMARLDAHFYNNFIKDLPEGMKYTVIFSTTPSNVVVEDVMEYEPTFDVGVHIDLKRAILTRVPPKTKSNDSRPLFEKYQFFTPGLFSPTQMVFHPLRTDWISGLFMGIIVSLLLLSILSVGISAISSLEVSYGAFDKEMGPAAQKKAQ